MSLRRLPEKHDEIPRGFLTEIWTAKEALPKFSVGERYLYFLTQGIKNVISLPITSGVAIITLAVSVFLSLGIFLLLSNTENLLAAMGNTLNISVYLKSGTSDATGRRLTNEIRKSPDVRSVEYLSQAEALRLFRQTLGERSNFLDGLDSKNPLPASLEINLRPSDNATAFANDFVSRMRAIPEVEDVVHGAEWLEKAQAYLSAFRMFSVFVMALVLAVVSFLVGSTTKLILYSRRAELEIMQLVGASSWFVRAPFLLGGAFQGVVGTLVGLLLLSAAFALLRSYIGALTVFGATVPMMSFLSVGQVFAVIVGGTLISVLASFVALRRFMET